MSGFPWGNLGSPVAGTEYGLKLPKPRLARFVLRVGTVGVGDVMMIDNLNTDTTSTTWSNLSTGITSNLIAPRAGLLSAQATEGAILVVVTDLLGGAGADNTDVMACFYGPVTAFVLKASGSVVFGEQLGVSTAKNMLAGLLTTSPVVGFALQALTTPSTRALGRVFLTNGYSGMERPR